MSTLSTVPVSRTPWLVERPIIMAAHDSKGNAHSSAATAGKRDSAMSQFLTALLRSFCTWTV
jgi:hypothetical protein